MSPRKPGFFAYVFSRKRSVKERKNAAQCISSHLKATSKNSGTFENTQKKVDFPLSIVFNQALQLFSPNFRVTSSEKVDKIQRYSDFCLWSVPYPGMLICND